LHMAKNRLRMFALKPAPAQVCWLAYQGTTGLPQMDFRLSDPHLDPPGMFDEFYSERTIRLPETFWCYDPLTAFEDAALRPSNKRDEFGRARLLPSRMDVESHLAIEARREPRPPVNDLPALRNGFVTFGSLNAFCKVNPPLLRLWASVLRAVPNSRLMLLAPEGSHRETTLSLFETECVARERIVFVAKRPRAEYLSYFNDIDISLDTLPYGGQTTSLDSFWMGVPVISMLGTTAVGRAGASQLRNLGLPELIAESPEQFVAIAVALAKAPQRLIELRSTLRQRLLNSPLMDGPRFARHVEEAFRQIDILSRATDC
jgi:protein O-GlcNAc transferase